MSRHTCMKCGKEISNEIHVVEGDHYCSKECAVDALTSILIDSAKDQAIEWYNECAEIFDKKGE